MVSTLIAGIGAMVLLSKLLGGGESLDSTALRGLVTPILMQAGFAILVLSLGLYSASMRHIKIVDPNEIKVEKPVSDWETGVLTHLHNLEKWHSWAGKAFGLAVFLIFLSLVVPVVGKICAMAIVELPILIESENQ